jgi:hypothetical protein
MNFSSYCIPLKLIYTFRDLFTKFHLFGVTSECEWSYLYSLVTRYTEDSLTPVKYAAFLTMSPIKMF